MMAFGIENIAILNIKDIDYRSVVWKMSRSDAINRSSNSKLDNKWNVKWKDCGNSFNSWIDKEDVV